MSLNPGQGFMEGMSSPSTTTPLSTGPLLSEGMQSVAQSDQAVGAAGRMMSTAAYHRRGSTPDLKAGWSPSSTVCMIHRRVYTLALTNRTTCCCVGCQVEDGTLMQKCTTGKTKQKTITKQNVSLCICLPSASFFFWYITVLSSGL